MRFVYITRMDRQVSRCMSSPHSDSLTGEIIVDCEVGVGGVPVHAGGPVIGRHTINGFHTFVHLQPLECFISYH